MKKCQVTGKKSNKACQISHSHHRTIKQQNVNLQWKKVWDLNLKRLVVMRISTKALKTLMREHL
uniref:ribosomal protein L28 n=1 Tax=Glaucosphaera vacuolata TaxID=38265 RepID=UPI001FCD4952|nr:ribosomal protein L28 [Glaucosphaera vacuolata]UNJ18653.1 ribosomal protein L28 [Glaucosphaera vacuolata]